MPTKPKTFCLRPKAERQREYDRQRGSAANRGYDSKWRKARLGWLAKHPLCNHCGRLGTDVDHIIKHNGDAKLFWDFKKNIQTLCKSCHAKKTASGG